MKKRLLVLLTVLLVLAACTLYFYPLSRERMLEIRDALEKRKTKDERE